MSDAVVTASYPKEIAAAIIGVKKQIKQLGSDEKNEHGGYRYVSVDKFYERIGPMMAEAGLALLIDETDTDVRISETTDRNGQIRKTPWLFAQYSLAFMHEAGGISAPMRRSLAMPITGPQSYGAAQSYVEKQFLRQIFKIPTGEKDADETAQDQDPPARRPQTNGATRTVAAPPPPEKPAHLNGNGGRAPLPPHPEETREERLKRAAIRIGTALNAAPEDHMADLVMEDARDELAEMMTITDAIFKFKDGPPLNGIEAAKRLRARHNARIAELRNA